MATPCVRGTKCRALVWIIVFLHIFIVDYLTGVKNKITWSIVLRCVSKSGALAQLVKNRASAVLTSLKNKVDHCFKLSKIKRSILTCLEQSRTLS